MVFGRALPKRYFVGKTRHLRN